MLPKEALMLLQGVIDEAKSEFRIVS